MGDTTLKPDRIVSTICPYCGVGCNLQLHVKDAAAFGRYIYKVTSPFDSVVNHGNLCVKGRFGYDFIYSPNRVTVPLIRKSPQSPGHRTQAFDLNEWREVAWDGALDYVADRLTEIYKRDGPDALAVYCCAKATNEDNYLLQKMFRALFRTNNVDHCTRLCHAGSVAALLKLLGTTAMSNTALPRCGCRSSRGRMWRSPGGLSLRRGLTTTEILSHARPGGVRSLTIMGENPMMTEPNLNVTRHHMEQLEFLVAQDIFINESGAFADVFLPATSWAETEGTFTNTDRRVQRVRQAIEPPDDEYPLIRTTGRVLEHWHGGTMTRHSQLDALYPEALLELHEVDAEQHGIRDGDGVRVSSRRGSVVLRARVTTRCNRGVVFIPMHSHEAANLLTIDALDATAKIPEYKACAVCIVPAGSARP